MANLLEPLSLGEVVSPPRRVRIMTPRKQMRLLYTLEDLFDRWQDARSVRNSPDDLRWLLVALFEGDIRISWSHISADTCQGAKRFRYHSRIGESAAHKFLKVCTQDWLKLQGVKDAKLEVTDWRWRYDVFSQSVPWIIECGNTPINKLRMAVRSQKLCRFSLVPYQEGALRFEQGERELPLIIFHFNYGKDFHEREVADDLKAIDLAWHLREPVADAAPAKGRACFGAVC